MSDITLTEKELMEMLTSFAKNFVYELKIKREIDAFAGKISEQIVYEKENNIRPLHEIGECYVGELSLPVGEKLSAEEVDRIGMPIFDRHLMWWEK